MIKDSKPKPFKKKKCKNPVCGKVFQPARPLQSVCSPSCALAVARIKGAAKSRQVRADQNKAVRKERQELREARDRLKTRRQWIAEVQKACNAFIRERDKDYGCISCGVRKDIKYDAGHYRPTSTAPALRFDPMNIHKQCVQCNRHMHGNLTIYRIKLERKIGVHEVERLEKNHAPRKFTIPELETLKAHFVLLLKNLKKSA